jgi:hypothetical protein
MVAINNNNFGNTLTILDSKNTLDKTDELFAELFALINSAKIESSEDKTALVKEFISSPIKPIKPINLELGDKNQKIPEEFKNSTPNLNLASDLVSEEEILLAKSLIQVFYKEMGIQEHEVSEDNVKNLNEKIGLDIKKKDLPNHTQNKNNLNVKRNNDFVINFDDKDENPSEKPQEFIFNIIKKKLDTKKVEPLENRISKSKKSELKNNEIAKSTDLGKKNILPHSDITSNLVEKKSKKKIKQFDNPKKEKVENKTLENFSKKIQTKVFDNVNIKSSINRDNQINIKKENFEKNDVGFKENKSLGANTGSKDILDLLENNWGEKFTKILKDSIKSGLNKVELELKPKNLGKISLEISVKNNKTTINISSENQEVVSILNDNLPKLSDLIDKDNKGFSSLITTDNQQNNHFGQKQNKENSFAKNSVIKKERPINQSTKKITDHNIDVNA